MESLPTRFTHRNVLYTQLKRYNNLAIYEQHIGKAHRYEVVLIQYRPTYTFPNGITVEAHEAYPSSSQWGTYGFTYYSLGEAELKFNEMIGG